VSRLRPPAALLIGVLAIHALAGAAHAASPGRDDKPGRREVLKTVERARVLMGTACTITASGFDSAWVSKSVDDAFGEIDRLDGVLSSWRQDSELSAVNAGGAERRIPCSPDLFAVLDSSLVIARETGGAFDPTIEPLSHVWDLRGAGRVPSDSELAGALQRVGFDMVQTTPEPPTVRFRRDGMALDFGGIGKGYALDRAGALLRERRLPRALLNFGGELLAFSNGQAWVIEIADPEDRLRPAVRLVVRQGAVSTSGQGERFVTVDHQRYGHVIDPHGGRPLTTQATVTVIASSATRADGLSTALLVLGRDRARAYVESHPGIGAIWLEHDGEGIHAWRWNVATASLDPGVRAEWVP
jgi:thiamine biosynthesis lipoprotein